MERIRKDNPTRSEEEFRKVEEQLKKHLEEAERTGKKVRISGGADFLEFYPDGSLEWFSMMIYP
jgi:hypothetical protein